MFYTELENQAGFIQAMQNINTKTGGDKPLNFNPPTMKIPGAQSSRNGSNTTQNSEEAKFYGNDTVTESSGTTSNVYNSQPDQPDQPDTNMSVIRDSRVPSGGKLLS